jgi:hypothetical protein
MCGGMIVTFATAGNPMFGAIKEFQRMTMEIH